MSEFCSIFTSKSHPSTVKLTNFCQHLPNLHNLTYRGSTLAELTQSFFGIFNWHSSAVLQVGHEHLSYKDTHENSKLLQDASVKFHVTLSSLLDLPAVKTSNVFPLVGHLRNPYLAHLQQRSIISIFLYYLQA